jgi:dienelactone hydrolase
MKRLFLFLILASISHPLLAQKKAMDHDVYDGWQSLGQTRISDDGNWFLYVLTPQEGDNRLIITERLTNKTDTLHRVSRVAWSSDASYAAFFISPFYAQTREARIKKVKREDMPKDTLGIYSLTSRSLEKIADVKSFKMPEKGSGWIAYLKEKEKPAPKDTTRTNGANSRRPSDLDDTQYDEEIAVTTAKGKAKRGEGTTLILRNLKTSEERSYLFVSDYDFDETGTVLAIASVGNDSTVKAGITLVDLKTLNSRMISTGAIAYKSLTFNKEGSKFAFLADRDTTDAKQRIFDLNLWEGKGDSAIVVANQSNPAMPKGWMVSENATVSFSKNSTRLIFGTAPIPAPVDTTIIEMDMAKLDIWNWLDKELQPMQLVNVDREKRRSYLAMIRLRDRAMLQLADQTMASVSIPMNNEADFAIGSDDSNYQLASSWLGSTARDIYLINLANGQRELLHQAFFGFPQASPQGKYLYWYDSADRNWYAQDVKTRNLVNLTKSAGSNFYNESHDSPSEPGSYGAMGWTSKDESFLVYDKFDVWKTDPTGKKAPMNMTLNHGRSTHTQYRYQRLNPDEEFIDVSKPIVYTTFNTTTKYQGWANQAKPETSPIMIWEGPFTANVAAKAKTMDVMLINRGNFSDLPELYETTLSLNSFKQRSITNPQVKDYLWGTAELVKWMSADGVPLEGVLYKPEGFDASKKYPLMVYFYETHSEGLYRPMGPAPSASTINIPFFVSRGYLVFTPDIVYKEGYPGKSAENSIISGTLSLVEKGFVDEKKMAIQGQSWGGYQVAHLITRTNMFAAAGAGAPVSNMTSAYGGIRWQTGMSRMFQYEKTQSRIGATLWERPLYYLENSPLFKVPDIETPLLMMHNDNDGAVPWYQGIEMFVAMRRLAKPVWMLNYNGEAHNLVQRVNRKDLSIRLSQFFDHYLLGESMPVWMAEGVPAVQKGSNWGFDLVDDKALERINPTKQ